MKNIIIVLVIGAVAVFFITQKEQEKPSSSNPKTNEDSTPEPSIPKPSIPEPPNTRKGLLDGQFIKDKDNEYASSVEACYGQAKDQGAVAYIFRNENHPDMPNSCALLSSIHSTKLKGLNDHEIGCVDTSKDPVNSQCRNNSVAGMFNNVKPYSANNVAEAAHLKWIMKAAKHPVLCRTFASKLKEQGVKSWMYRTDDHPDPALRKTCEFYENAGNGNPFGQNDHITFCTDETKTPPNC